MTQRERNFATLICAIIFAAGLAQGIIAGMCICERGHDKQEEEK